MQCRKRLKFSKKWISFNSQWSLSLLAVTLSSHQHWNDGLQKLQDTNRLALHHSCAGRQPASKAGSGALFWMEKKITPKSFSGCCKRHRSAVPVAGVFFSAFSSPLLLTSSVFPWPWCISQFPETRCCPSVRKLFQDVSCPTAGKILTLVLANLNFLWDVSFPSVQFSNNVIFLNDLMFYKAEITF